jgi:hypothetical protein
MKKIFTLTVLFVGLSLATFAADRPFSKISVSSKTNTLVLVKIDGVNYSLDRFGSMTNAVTPGFHNIQISKVSNRGMFRWNRNQVIYTSSICVDPAQLVDICVDGFGNVSVNKTSYAMPDRGNHFGDHKDIDYGHGYKTDKDDHGSRFDKDQHFGRH